MCVLTTDTPFSRTKPSGQWDSAHLLLSAAVTDPTLFQRGASSSGNDDMMPSHPHCLYSGGGHTIFEAELGKFLDDDIDQEPYYLEYPMDKTPLVLHEHLHRDLPSIHLENEQQAFRIFGHPLTIDTLKAMNLQLEDLVGATLLYNLALVYHVNALRSCRRAWMEEADFLYRAASLTLARAVEQGTDGDV